LFGNLHGKRREVKKKFKMRIQETEDRRKNEKHRKKGMLKERQRRALGRKGAEGKLDKIGRLDSACGHR